MSEPLVSVVIPAYNTAAFVRQAIDSVLAQTYPEVEALVVDDGSTDETGAIVDAIALRDPRVRVVHKRNEGLPAARNTGVENAKGEYLCFLDADDWILPEKVQRQIDVLRKRPDVDLVYSEYRLLREADGTLFDLHRGRPPVPFPDILVYRNWFGVMVPLLRRSLFDSVGGFDTGLVATEDRDFWYRCAQRTEFVFEPGVVAIYRRHGDQMISDGSRMLQGQLQFAAKHFAGDRRKRRSFQAALYLWYAIVQKQRGAYLSSAYQLARFATSVNSVAEARFVWNLVRWAPMTSAGRLGRVDGPGDATRWE